MESRYGKDEDDNPDRWLISYADFITLLLAFFVVMFAMSSVQEKKYDQLQQSVRQALGQPSPDETASSEELNKPVPEESTALTPEKNMLEIAKHLEKELAPLISAGTVTITRSAQGVSIEINASILFPPGEANLQAESIQTLQIISSALKTHPYPIHVAGHTDNTDINSKIFPSNWELSAARASRVVRLFETNGIAKHNLLAIGFSDTQPTTSNETPEGRMKNRRVQITLESKGQRQTPSQLPHHI